MRIKELDDEGYQYIEKNKEQFNNNWTNYINQEEYLNPDYKTYVITDEINNIVGYITIWYGVEEIHIIRIIVAKDFKRNGYAKELLKYIEEKYLNTNSIEIEVNECNLAAIDLYKNFGYVEIGKRPKYYDNTYAAILYEKKKF